MSTNFPGTNGNYLSRTANLPPLTGNFSYAFFMRLTTQTGVNVPMIYDHNAGTFYTGFYVDTGTLYYISNSTFGATGVAITAVTTGVTYFVCTTHSSAGGTNTKVYYGSNPNSLSVNNIGVDTFGGNATNLVIGNELANDTPFDGPLISYKEWTIELSADQVPLEAMKMRPSTTTGMTAWYQFLNASATIDQSGNGNNLTLTGAVSNSRVMPAVPFSGAAA